MKIFKKLKLTDYFVLGVFLVFLVNRLPGIIESYKLEGSSVANMSLDLLNEPAKNLYDIQGPKVLIFWASWCAPCKFEMKRFHKAMANQEIPKDKILFVNMGENPKTIFKFLKKNNYSFRIVLDKMGKLSNKFKVSSTPTIVYLDESNHIKHVSTGISALTIYRAIWLFD